ncbi:MAG: hypothetical protein A2X05_00215 [Bacteroidetes bacterium GWE2_41_25]|nr:MAG: hypothetical protein A2X03_04455 [Bacteroidetes bacterium GWA2_40_15]OFY03232.1 MAG: hypothetical protein A2X05_00215 [Bacteroidetes bacterium GWE2_41_25]HBQ84527.1 hypothetical protein [Bacteroidales bacterium]HCU17983.1 hypothetical protein [Bacteroidales bacterium]
MKLLSLLVSILFVMNCIYSQTGSLTESSDTTSGDSRNSISISYRMVPDLAKYENRYKILTNVNENERAVLINYSLQNLLTSANYNDSSILKSFGFLKNNWTGNDISNTEILLDAKYIYYGAWRNNLVRTSSEAEIKQSMINGTRHLIDLGYTDLGRDFLPFITVLMEENHLINYDHARLFPGKASRGIVTSVKILTSLAAQNTKIKAGVCRDIHETGRELLKTMAETWYGHFYPEKKIDFDDYIFLQSWTTNKSQHVTISLINPLNTSEIYELDWGRVIQKKNITGFNSGRLYGNNYRIWKYDSEKQRSTALDFKRTQFGKILDEDILSAEEYRQFNGIYDEEFYSDIRFHKNMGKSGKMRFSLGSYHPYQKYFLSSWYLNTGRKKIAGFLHHSNKFALQAAIHEDTRKKISLYPQTDWKTAVSLMTIPRYISRFETPEYSFGNFTIEAFMNQQVDVFLIANSFITSDTIDKTTRNSISASGDGNVSFSNGFNIEYNSENRFLYSSAGVQARSCLLANDIRLFSPDPTVLIPNLKIITPAIDVMGNILFTFKRNCNLSFDALFEFTNMDAVLFSGSVTGKIGISEIMDLGISIGANDQLKGIKYFWYPAQRKWVDIRLNYSDNSFSAGLLKMPLSGTTINISFRSQFN